MENAYLNAVKARQKDQQTINNTIKDVKTMEKLNVTIPAEYKKKLKDYCEKNYTNPAAFIRMAIDEYC